MPEHHCAHIDGLLACIRMLTCTEHSDAASLSRNNVLYLVFPVISELVGVASPHTSFFGFKLLEHSTAEVLSDG